MNELHEKCKRKAEYVRLYRQRKKVDASSVCERIRNAERVRLHRKLFYIFDHSTERGMTERCSVILHHIHYSCRLKCNCFLITILLIGHFYLCQEYMTVEQFKMKCKEYHHALHLSVIYLYQMQTNNNNEPSAFNVCLANSSS
jgi:hypothetical protein